MRRTTQEIKLNIASLSSHRSATRAVSVELDDGSQPNHCSVSVFGMNGEDDAGFIFAVEKSIDGYDWSSVLTGQNSFRVTEPFDCSSFRYVRVRTTTVATGGGEAAVRFFFSLTPSTV